jgi:phosphoserine phosphatase
MDAPAPAARLAPGRLAPERLAKILEVTRNLAKPADLDGMLYEVVDAAKDLLDAEGGTVWQYFPGTHELEMRVARGLDPIRIPADRGIVGECVRTGAIINVPDCYDDPRFDRAMDQRTGHRTRCLLTLPLVGYDDSLVGVLQVVNRHAGVFDGEDEAMAAALAAQCAVALQRMQMTERLVTAEALRQEIAVAREIQLGTLPKAPPELPGYELAGLFRPTDDTGGDTYDFVPATDGALMVLMGDATGHGIGPALSATQVRAMLRLAQRFGASLDDTFRHINDQLVVDLPEDRFVTAFLGRLDPALHEIRYHSGGQGPLLHFHAAAQDCEVLPPTTFPMGAMPLARLAAPRCATLAPGDIFALVSDGVFEYQDAGGAQFGELAVMDLLRRHQREPMDQVLERLLDSISAFGRGAPQLDDITVVLVKRLALPDATDAADGWIEAQEFPRSFDALEPVFAFLDAALARARASADEAFAMRFTVEELFTNMVKYNAGGSGRIGLSLESRADALVGCLSDPDSERFDVTLAPDADVALPAEQRRPGGLGLHLIRRLVDAVEYDYSGRRSLITFRKQRGT